MKRRSWTEGDEDSSTIRHLDDPTLSEADRMTLDLGVRSSSNERRPGRCGS